jgi:2-polyprenyl-3-methyl-5-hydroxy-6-metoxy-1,4-benzoquinol methylase
MSVLSDISSFIERKIIRSDKARWDLRFKNGWSYLENIEELPRFSIIAGYVRFLKTNPDVLEMGCAEGVQAARTGKDAYCSWLGTDVSPTATDSANQRFGDEKTTFAPADMNDFETDKKFDLIIINEAIYYLTPIKEKMLNKYIPMLKPDGMMIISMNTGRNTDHETRWGILSEIFDLIDSTYTETSKGGWNIKVLKPKAV